MANLPTSVIGQKTMALSAPVVIASDQSAIPITGSFSLTPTGTQTVTGTVVTGGAAGQEDNSIFTEGSSDISVIAGEYNTSPGTLTSGNAGAVQVTLYRGLHINNRSAAGVEIFTSSAPGYVQGSVTAIPNGTQTITGAVTLATATITGTVVVSTSTVGVTSLPAIPAGTNTIGVVSLSGTSPVSGTVVVSTTTVGVSSLPTFPAGTNTIGAVIISGTSPVSGTVTITPSGTQTATLAGTSTISGAVTLATTTVGVTSLPALPTGTNTIGVVSITGTETVVLAAGTAIFGSCTAIPVGTQTIAGTLAALTTGTITGTVVSSTALATITAIGTATVLLTNTDAAGAMYVDEEGQKASFFASQNFIVATNATHITYFPGSASKTIRLRRMQLTYIGAAALDNLIVSLQKLSSTNAGGTSTAYTVGSMDSGNAAVTGAPVYYTANATALGTSAGIILERYLYAPVVATASNFEPIIYEFGYGVQCPVLRGTAQALAITLGSSNGTNTGNATVSLWWTEE